MIASADEFVRLRTSNDPAEYGRAARDEASDSVWSDVVRSHPDMRRWVAHNKTVPISILNVLASDADENVRLAVAEKRKLTETLFDVLSRDLSSSVRQRIAYNAKTPRAVLERLSLDADGFVSAAARNRLA